MSPYRGPSPLSYRRIGLAELGVAASLELEHEQVERFLGPLSDILQAIRRGLAHSMIGIEAAGELIGFYVIHPDARDQSCWWLGWFAIDRRKQGRGYGRVAMAAIMDRLRRVGNCRRIRLLVAPENATALSLYRRAGFQCTGAWQATGELIMECRQARCAKWSEAAGPAVAMTNLFYAAWSRSRLAGSRAAARTHGRTDAQTHRRTDAQPVSWTAKRHKFPLTGCGHDRPAPAALAAPAVPPGVDHARSVARSLAASTRWVGDHGWRCGPSSFDPRVLMEHSALLYKLGTLRS